MYVCIFHAFDRQFIFIILFIFIMSWFLLCVLKYWNYVWHDEFYTLKDYQVACYMADSSDPLKIQREDLERKIWPLLWISCKVVRDGPA